MKQKLIPLGEIMLYVSSIILMTALMCYLWHNAYHKYMLLPFLVLVICLFRLFALYGGILKKLNFVFSAVQNDDYSFRFAEDKKITRHAMVNYTLNRIKEIMDDVKDRMREKERSFQLIMECVNTGIVTIMENGTVVQTNSAALQIMGIECLTHIDQLRTLSDDLYNAIEGIRPQQQRTVRYTTGIDEKSILVGCSSMEFDGRRMRVISIDNIREELDSKELESWEKLTRILTHEIMNSLAPVTSISHSLISSENDDLTIQRGLETIHSTSESLMRFVDSFRSVTRIPTPQKSLFHLSDLLTETFALISCDDVDIVLDIEPVNTMLYADRTLMSQVFVNLLKNAKEALIKSECNERQIRISSRIDAEERIHIEITNNGIAIPAEAVEIIFTPFFTTKIDGSGIGLAVSRQILRLHGGSLRLQHNEEGRVTFAIVVE